MISRSIRSARANPSVSIGMGRCGSCTLGRASGSCTERGKTLRHIGQLKIDLPAFSQLSRQFLWNRWLQIVSQLLAALVHSSIQIPQSNGTNGPSSEGGGGGGANSRTGVGSPLMHLRCIPQECPPAKKCFARLVQTRPARDLTGCPQRVEVE